MKNKVKRKPLLNSLPNNRQQTPPPTPEELAAIDAIPEEAIDYSDIPELDAEFFE